MVQASWLIAGPANPAPDSSARPAAPSAAPLPVRRALPARTCPGASSCPLFYSGLKCRLHRFEKYVTIGFLFRSRGFQHEYDGRIEGTGKEPLLQGRAVAGRRREVRRHRSASSRAGRPAPSAGRPPSRTRVLVQDALRVQRRR